jgi:hypothetical protein
MIKSVGFDVFQNLIQIWSRMGTIWVAFCGVVYMQVGLFYPGCLAQPNRWILEKLVERLAYTPPLDTVNLLGVHDL